MVPSIVSLVPPLTLFLVAALTHSVLLAFSIGVFVALLIITQVQPFLMVQLLLQQVVAYFSDKNVIMSFLFLISIGSIITLLTTIRLRLSKQKRSKPSVIFSARMVEYIGFFFSFLFSIDDYLSILTVGFLMTQLSEKYSIAKERIAYFVHALSGPLVILIPISSWAAEIISQLYQAGVHAKITSGTVIESNPLFLYIASMGYNFYSFLTIFSVLFFIQTQKIIGKTEQRSVREMQYEKNDTTFPVFDIGLPLFILLSATLVGLLLTGDYHLFGGQCSLLEALQSSTSTFFVLAASGWIAFVVGFFYQMIQKRITKHELWSCLFGGLSLMKGAMMLISLASIFGVFVRRDLLAGIYLADNILVQIPVAFMPLMTFITALLIAIITGTAWGTFALMIPIVIQMLMTVASISGITTPEAVPFLLPCLGAIFSGGVCGDHLSPFSETTIMTATATDITPMQHVRSQFFYAIAALTVTILLFALFGIFPCIYSYSPFALIILGSFFCVLFIQTVEKFGKNSSINKKI